MPRPNANEIDFLIARVAACREWELSSREDLDEARRKHDLATRIFAEATSLTKDANDNLGFALEELTRPGRVEEEFSDGAQDSRRTQGH